MTSSPVETTTVEYLLQANMATTFSSRVTGEHLLQANMATTFSSPTTTMFARPRFTSFMSTNGRGQFRNQHP